MALSSKTDLWKLAATMMGMSPVQNVLNADSPTTALEATFNILYDQIRTNLILAGQFDFAKRGARLRLAPTLDYLGNRNVWTESWDFVYAPPIDMLRFVRWRDSVSAALSSVPDFQQISLPIQYKKITGAPSGTDITGSGIANAWPGGVYVDGVYGYFIDDSLKVHELVDAVDDSVSPAGVLLKHTASGFTWSSTLVYGISESPWTIPFAPFIASGEADLAAAPPGGLIVEVAYGSALLNDKATPQTQHIATNLQPSDAFAVYLADVDQVVQMPVEFQNALASELAYRASITHAKAPRMIQYLEREMMRMFSLAVSSLSSDDGHVEGGGFSRATRARW